MHKNSSSRNNEISSCRQQRCTAQKMIKRQCSFKRAAQELAERLVSSVLSKKIGVKSKIWWPSQLASENGGHANGCLAMPEISCGGPTIVWFGVATTWAATSLQRPPEAHSVAHTLLGKQFLPHLTAHTVLRKKFLPHTRFATVHQRVAKRNTGKPSGLVKRVLGRNLLSGVGNLVLQQRRKPSSRSSFATPGCGTQRRWHLVWCGFQPFGLAHCTW